MANKESTAALRHSIYHLNHAAAIARRVLRDNDSNALVGLKQYWKEIVPFVDGLFEDIDEYNKPRIAFVERVKKIGLDEEKIGYAEKDVLKFPDEFEKIVKNVYTKVGKMTEASYKIGDNIDLTYQEIDDMDDLLWNFFQTNLKP